jgi:SPW repeat
VKGMRIIPTKTHGTLDYIVGILLIASPWIFGFNNESSTAKWTFIVIGIVVLATSLMTNYELGLMHVVPMHMHLMADALAGIVLAVSPWIFGYSGDAGKNAWLPAIVIGLGELAVAAMSDPWPTRHDVAERERRLVRTA